MKIAMTKIDEVKIEIINNPINIKWVEKIEIVTPEVIEVPTYEYWQSQNQLDYEISLRNKPKATWWQYFCWNSSRLTTDWTWNQVITWVWFIPKMVVINAVYAWTWWQISFWEATSSANDFCVFLDLVNWASYNPARIIDVWASRAELTSLDTDWFTLNWTSIWVNITFTYKCYW